MKNNILLVGLCSLTLTAGAQDALQQYTIPICWPPEHQQISSSGAMAVAGFIVIGTGAYMSWKLKHAANDLLNVVRFPDPVNATAPFWPINSANLNGKKSIGLVVDCSATAYHQRIPAANRWMNPNTGLDFTDAYTIRFRATSDFRTWPQFDASIWVDEGYNFVMVYCGAACQGNNAGVIFLPMEDLGPDKGFVQSYR